jgi:hypothetical protein
MLRIIQSFGKHFSCHLQGECVEAGRFDAFLGQPVSGELNFMVLIGAAKT